MILSISLPDRLNFLECLPRFRIAFSASILNQGLVLAFYYSGSNWCKKSRLQIKLCYNVLKRIVHTGVI